MKPNRLIFLLIALLMTPAFGAETDHGASRHSCCASVTAGPGLPTDKSLYQLDSTWTDDQGRTFKLASLRGRPQVVCMFFASCQYACPLLVERMKQIEAALPENLRTNTGFVLVSFDTERDTAAVLHRYRAQHDLATERWTLLRANTDDVLELAALLGVKYKKDAQGQFMHSNVTTLLNSQGEIAFQEIGLNLATEGFVTRLKSVVE